jgi:hypothetical protein
MPAAQSPAYRSIEQIGQLVQAFEAGSLPPSQFNHQAHLTVALWYLAHLPFAEAAATMRHNIQHFAAAHQHSQLYHETITMFWMRLLRHVLDTKEPGDSLPDVVCRTIRTFGDMQPFFRHYSREHAFSPQARQQWVEPDLLPLPFDKPDA